MSREYVKNSTSTLNTIKSLQYLKPNNIRNEEFDSNHNDSESYKNPLNHSSCSVRDLKYYNGKTDGILVSSDVQAYEMSLDMDPTKSQDSAKSTNQKLLKNRVVAHGAQMKFSMYRQAIKEQQANLDRFEARKSNPYRNLTILESPR